jgi:glycerophosphoryl diester phosphodiesterase
MALDWLTARPIAHRGLHDAAHGIVENTAAAVRAAVAGNYGIEVDLQISADGEAMVHHDDVLGRLTDGESRLDRLTAAELKRVAYRDNGAERMLTLGDLCDLIGGRVGLLPELKSRFDGNGRLPARVAAVLSGYGGPVAPMSFDPMQLEVLRQKAPHLPRGIVAAKYRPHPYWDQMPPWLRYRMGSLLPALTARPHFVAYAGENLPALAPTLARHVLCLPIVAWVVRTKAERQRVARFADQVIFEGFRP